MCLSADVTITAIGERGEAMGEAEGRPMRVRLDLLILEGRAIEIGDIVRVDCGLALEVVDQQGAEP
jgi:hydrogenase maturation factor